MLGAQPLDLALVGGDHRAQLLLGRGLGGGDGGLEARLGVGRDLLEVGGGVGHRLIGARPLGGERLLGAGLLGGERLLGAGLLGGEGGAGVGLGGREGVAVGVLERGDPGRGLGLGVGDRAVAGGVAGGERLGVLGLERGDPRTLGLGQLGAQGLDRVLAAALALGAQLGGLGLVGAGQLRDGLGVLALELAGAGARGGQLLVEVRGLGRLLGQRAGRGVGVAPGLALERGQPGGQLGGADLEILARDLGGLDLVDVADDALLELEVLALELGLGVLELAQPLLAVEDLPVLGDQLVAQLEDLAILAGDHLAQVQELALARRPLGRVGGVPGLVDLGLEARVLALEDVDLLQRAAVVDAGLLGVGAGRDLLEAEVEAGVDRLGLGGDGLGLGLGGDGLGLGGDGLGLGLGGDGLGLDGHGDGLGLDGHGDRLGLGLGLDGDRLGLDGGLGRDGLGLGRDRLRLGVERRHLERQVQRGVVLGRAGHLDLELDRQLHRRVGRDLDLHRQIEVRHRGLGGGIGAADRRRGVAAQHVGQRRAAGAGALLAVEVAGLDRLGDLAAPLAGVDLVGPLVDRLGDPHRGLLGDEVLDHGAGEDRGLAGGARRRLGDLELVDRRQRRGPPGRRHRRR
ncbi:MAG: hypothetical protein H6709_00780 [Kofleriaceae bacterium]|nr:hypothetical protein [Kofleriaceae bacterium]